MEQRRLEEIADAVVERLAEFPKRSPGAPPNTEDDPSLVEELINKHRDTKLAQNEFIKIICKRHNIKKKRASERFRKAMSAFKSRNT